MDPLVVAALVFLGWLLYRLGFENGRARQSRLDNLYARAMGEQDPAKRAELLTAWTKLAG